jgi:hypothetical protein
MKLASLLMLYAFVCDGKFIRPLMDKRSILFNETVPVNYFGQSGFGGSWVGENEFTYYSAGNLMKFNVNTNSSSELIKSGFGVMTISNLKINYLLIKFF